MRRFSYGTHILQRHHQRRSRNTNHDDAVDRLQWAKQLEPLGHDDVAVAQAREVDGRVIDSRVQRGKFTQHSKHDGPDD